MTDPTNNDLLDALAATLESRPGPDRLRVNTSPREEATAADGFLFTGSTQRTGIPSGDTYYTAFETGDKWVIVEDVDILANFSEVTDGNMLITLDVFCDNSNGNTWSYAPGTPIPAGRPLNSAVVNNFPLSTIDLGVSASVAGTPDYEVYYQSFYIDTQGNRNNVSSTEGRFFEGGRKLLLAPNSSFLIRTLTAGGATGMVDLITVFFVSEIEVSALGV